MVVQIFRGRRGDPEADRKVSQRLLEVASEGDRGIRVWMPHRQVVFGRRDGTRDGYERAQSLARDRGFRPVARRVGGRAVAYDGETTVAFACAEPVDDLRTGLDDRYERMTATLERSLERLGTDVVRGEPSDSFCPGSHSLSIATGDGTSGERTNASATKIDCRPPNGNRTSPGLRKVSGLAQRITQDAALVSGILVIDSRVALAIVLESVYDALSVPFDPASVGAIGESNSDIDPATVRSVLEEDLAGSETAVVRNVDGDAIG